MQFIKKYRYIYLDHLGMFIVLYYRGNKMRKEHIMSFDLRTIIRKS